MLDGLFIRVEEAVSWTHRFLTRNIGPKNRSLLMKNKFENKCFQKFYVLSKQEKECYRKTTSYLEQPSRHFCQQFMRRTTQQTFLAINLASQQKTTKLHFSSQVRKQFKLLTVPLSHYAVFLRSDKLVNCHVLKFCKDPSWFDPSINSYFLMVSSLSLLRSLRVCVYTKTIILFKLGE